MVPPLCLPRAVEQHELMLSLLEALIRRRIGPTIGTIQVYDNLTDDSRAEFACKYLTKDDRHATLKGSLFAAWTARTHNNKTVPMETYVTAYIYGGETWRIFLGTDDYTELTD